MLSLDVVCPGTSRCREIRVKGLSKTLPCSKRSFISGGFFLTEFDQALSKFRVFKTISFH